MSRVAAGFDASPIHQDAISPPRTDKNWPTGRGKKACTHRSARCRFASRSALDVALCKTRRSLENSRARNRLIEV